MCREFSTHSLSIADRSFIDGETKCGDEYWRRVLIGAIAASPNHIDHSSHRKGINFVSSRRIWINFFISSTFSHHWICSWNLAVPQPLMSFWNLSTRPLSMPKIILVRDFHTPTHFAIIIDRQTLMILKRTWLVIIPIVITIFQWIDAGWDWRGVP